MLSGEYPVLPLPASVSVVAEAIAGAAAIASSEASTTAQARAVDRSVERRPAAGRSWPLAVDRSCVRASGMCATAAIPAFTSKRPIGRAIEWDTGARECMLTPACGKGGQSRALARGGGDDGNLFDLGGVERGDAGPPSAAASHRGP